MNGRYQTSLPFAQAELNNDVFCGIASIGTTTITAKRNRVAFYFPSILEFQKYFSKTKFREAFKPKDVVKPVTVLPVVMLHSVTRCNTKSKMQLYC